MSTFPDRQYWPDNIFLFLQILIGMAPSYALKTTQASSLGDFHVVFYILDKLGLEQKYQG